MNDASVRLIVGLGNPGEEYRYNRHNLGFLVVEELARIRGIAFRPGGPSYLIATDSSLSGDIVLLKPMTYMNRSGQALEAWSCDTGLEVTGVHASLDLPEVDEAIEAPDKSEAVRPLVVCDDLNLPLGSVRLRPRGSSGGQNGLVSVIDHLGGEEFPRLRLGIAPLDREIDPVDWPDHVLADFDPEEQSAADDLVAHAASALEFWLAQGLESAISRFNRRVRPDSEQTE
ncbi:MAG: peptidyl-tRNA hydrolase [Candidatus Krumholzibacteria bacterium]|nr:peptidyl-tRNA hydrolase [Candidatus Krumholzibacteria bacterium]